MEEITMGAARLKVILGENNVEKLILPNGIPQSLLELVNVVKNTFGITTEIRLQYMDQDFGNEFFNLNATSELQDLGTIKVVQQEVVPLIITLTDDVSSACATFDAVDCSLQASNNTNILPSPPKLSFRSVQWPAVFPIPQFSYDTELVLERGNAEYKSSSKLVYLSTRTKSDILNKVSEEIFKYKAYPCDEHFVAVAEALIKKHPCLKEPGSSNGWYGWKQRLKYKMGNLRTQLRLHGCPEVAVNSMKSKVTEGSSGRNVKRPKRAEANFYPSLPTGDTSESLEQERLSLLTEVKIRHNDRVIADKMARTFAYRRQEVVDGEPRIQDFKGRWPALFDQREINAEFQRLVALPLEQKFFSQLDKYSTKLMTAIRSRGGSTREKISGLTQIFDQTEDVNKKRECVLKALVPFLGEDGNAFIKEYTDSHRAEMQKDLEDVTMAVYVIRSEGDELQGPPEDIGIVIEGVEVLDRLSSVGTACALLLGLIYILNLAYPKVLRFTFEVLQKIIMELEPQKMSPKVQNLYVKLLNMN
ncbi:uncharacterized protein [Nothobranchius furzeri]|uniref:uncharacterized protein isoform X2 n=1 Tax=Nothobranchius furzeri TaxID=105023 RepID=UPI00240425AC|nr:sterile alpha motif domain-containing protein 3 isoform X3 [Nothobranchius furzeri]XP_054599136.1 sterile alpha motif domain-containing protein 3 isoform X3 [Nothobranchius furzeri]XP_054599137.1 sterile alpha motif domain-containing protein 3 isoform X3 [Nothobranchius furzeri]